MRCEALASIWHAVARTPYPLGNQPVLQKILCPTPNLIWDYLINYQKQVLK